MNEIIEFLAPIAVLGGCYQFLKDPIFKIHKWLNLISNKNRIKYLKNSVVRFRTYNENATKLVAFIGKHLAILLGTTSVLLLLNIKYANTYLFNQL